MSSSTSSAAPAQGATQSTTAPPSAGGGIITQAPPTAPSMEMSQPPPVQSKANVDANTTTYTYQVPGGNPYTQEVHRVPPTPLGARVKEELRNARSDAVNCCLGPGMYEYAAKNHVVETLFDLESAWRARVAFSGGSIPRPRTQS
ncbi:hypothetical protein CHU98_g11213 [Xylaria longipes]|nr:hypothetical protein CHU98_g11213 [Xylaria longipes]